MVPLQICHIGPKTWFATMLSSTRRVFNKCLRTASSNDLRFNDEASHRYGARFSHQSTRRNSREQAIRPGQAVLWDISPGRPVLLTHLPSERTHESPPRVRPGSWACDSTKASPRDAQSTRPAARIAQNQVPAREGGGSRDLLVGLGNWRGGLEQTELDGGAGPGLGLDREQAESGGPEDHLRDKAGPLRFTEKVTGTIKREPLSESSQERGPESSTGAARRLKSSPPPPSRLPRGAWDRLNGRAGGPRPGRPPGGHGRSAERTWSRTRRAWSPTCHSLQSTRLAVRERSRL